MFKKIIAHHDFITGKPKYNYSVRQRGRLTEDGQMVLPFDDGLENVDLGLHPGNIEPNTQLIIHGNGDGGDAAITVINNDTTIRNLTVTDYLNTPNRVGDVTYDIELSCLKTWNGMEWLVI